jgi:glutathione S-transferase
MKLHWSPRSPFVRKVMVAAHELGVVDRLDTVRTVVAMTNPNRALFADNPLGKIPTLVLDDGTILYDSAVIVEYLDTLTGGGRMIPRDGAARSDVLRRHALANGFLDMLILWRNEREKQHPSLAWMDGFTMKTDAVLARLEAEVPGDGADLATITTAIAGDYMDFRFPDLRWRERCPRLAAWHARFAARPSMLATAIVDA